MEDTIVIHAEQDEGLVTTEDGEITEMEKPRKRKRVTLAAAKALLRKCPAVRCAADMLTVTELEDHWMDQHEPMIIMYLCLESECNLAKSSLAKFWRHLRVDHQWSTDRLVAGTDLTLLCDKRVNKFYKNPRCASAYATPVLPIKWRCFAEKKLVRQEMITAQLRDQQKDTRAVVVSAEPEDPRWVEYREARACQAIAEQNAEKLVRAMMAEKEAENKTLRDELDSHREQGIDRHVELCDENTKLKTELKQRKEAEDRLRKERNEAKDEAKKWRKRCQELEANYHGPPKVVKDIKKFRTTMALILYPHPMGCVVYRLETEDVVVLKLDKRTLMGDLDRI